MAMSEFDKYNDDEVLDFEEDGLPEFPDDNPFDNRDNKKPWALVAVGIVAVTLVLVVVIKLMTSGPSSRGDLGLIEIPIDMGNVPVVESPDDFANDAERLLRGREPARPAERGMPDRVVETRPAVAFNPDAPIVQRPAATPARPAPRPAAQPARAAQPAAPAATPRPAPAPTGGAWHAQVGAHSTRAAAETGQRRLQSRPEFAGRNLVILQAVTTDGSAVHRLRVTGFQTSAAAEAFCRTVRNAGNACFATR